MPRRNALTLSALVLAIAGFSFAASQAQTPEQQPAAPAGTPAATQAAPGGPRRPIPKPVNLQVLPKDMTGEQVVAQMRRFKADLGVECSYCHTPNPQTHRLDFASDAKREKATARVMIAMTRDMNEKYLKQLNDPDVTITCGTCHRGHGKPEKFVPPVEPEHDHP